MNWGKRILTAAALSAIFASGLVGCNKSSNNNNGTSGNISINGAPGLNGVGGQTASATDTVSGMPVTLTLSTATGYNPNSGNYYGTSAISILMNGYPVNLTPMTMQTYYNQGPSIVSSSGQYAILAAAICADSITSTYAQTCSTVAIIAWVQPSYSLGGSGYPYGGVQPQYGTQFNPSMQAMQVGILKDQAGTIHSAVEKVGYAIYNGAATGSPALSTATDLTTWLVQNAH